MPNETSSVTSNKFTEQNQFCVFNKTYCFQDRTKLCFNLIIEYNPAPFKKNFSVLKNPKLHKVIQ